MAFLILDMYVPWKWELETFWGTFFVHKFKNNALCYNMLNRLHVMYIDVYTNCQEEFLLYIEYIYIYIYILKMVDKV